MDVLPSGRYKLRNVQHPNLAAVLKTDDDEPVTTTTLAIGEEQSLRGYKWEVLRYDNKQYTLKCDLGVFARSSMNKTYVVSSPDKEYWTVWHVGDSLYKIGTISDKTYWILRTDNTGEGIDLDKTANAKSALWQFEDLGVVPAGLSSPSDTSPFNPKRNVIILDFLSGKNPRKRLDVVVLHVVEGSINIALALRSLAGELRRLAKDNALALDLRIGSVVCTRTGANWIVVTGWMDGNSFRRESKVELSGPFPFTVTLETALQMKWRDDASRVIIVAPNSAPPPSPDDTQIDNMVRLDRLIGQARKASMLLILDGPKDVRSPYMQPGSFFSKLVNICPQETIVVPENLMANWILASTSYPQSVTSLIEVFKPLATAWDDNHMPEEQELDEQFQVDESISLTTPGQEESSIELGVGAPADGPIRSHHPSGAHASQSVTALYASLLMNSCQGHALFYPRSAAEGGGQIGDCGYIMRGSFQTLFNVYDDVIEGLPQLILDREQDVVKVEKPNSRPFLSSRAGSVSFSLSFDEIKPPLNISPLSVQPAISLKSETESFAFLTLVGPLHCVETLKSSCRQQLQQYAVENTQKIQKRFDSTVIFITGTTRASGYIGGCAYRRRTTTVSRTSPTHDSLELITRGPPEWHEGDPAEQVVSIKYISVKIGKESSFGRLHNIQ